LSAVQNGSPSRVVAAVLTPPKLEKNRGSSYATELSTKKAYFDSRNELQRHLRRNRRSPVFITDQHSITGQIVAAAGRSR
jgi:hypothetical protein